MKLSFLRHIFSRKNLLRLLFFTALFFTIIMVLFQVYAWRSKAAWEKYYKQAEARGVDFTLANFNKPAIPDENNYAANPYIAGLFGTEEQQKASRAMELHWPITRYPRSKVGIFQDGTLCDILAMRDFFVSEKNIQTPSNDPAADILKFTDTIPSLKYLRDASSRSDCHFPVQLTLESSSPHVYAFKQATRWFEMRAEAYIAKGDRDAARTECMQIFRMMKALESQQIQVSFCVRANILQHACVIIHSGIAHSLWTQDDLIHFERILEEQNLAEHWKKSLKTERAFIATHMLELYRNNKKMLENLYVFNSPFIPNTGLFYSNLIKINECFDLMDEHIKTIQTQKSGYFTDSYYSANLDFFTSPTRLHKIEYELAIAVAPFYTYIEEILVHALNVCHQAQLACLLEQEYLVTKKYPENIDQITSTHQKLKDECDGKAMHYQRTDKGYKLWSVGKNLTDDGGVYTPKVYFSNQKDWVWTLNRAE